jgi:hypothetical protein
MTPTPAVLIPAALKPRTAHPTKPLSARLPIATVEAVEAFAAKRSVTVSSVINVALSEYLGRQRWSLRALASGLTLGAMKQRQPNPAAQALGRRSRQKLTKAQRRESASNAARVRWDKIKAEKDAPHEQR